MGAEISELAQPETRARGWWVPTLFEVLAAFIAMALMLWLATGVKVDPRDRMGQVSGLANLQIRFLVIALPAVIALIVSTRVRGGAHFGLVGRVVCAALAGLATGFVASGLIVALRGTPWCLNGRSGDSEQLVIWANAIKAHYTPEYPPPFYPPMFPYVLRWYMGLSDQPGFYALKDLQILFTAISGPLAYLAWRLLLRPGWALGIGVIAALVVLEPYKPYGSLVLVTFLPVMIAFLRTLRRAHQRKRSQLVWLGLLFGAVFGLSCLMYSGWYRWSAPGILVAAVILLPWKKGRTSAIIFGAAASVMFVAVTFSYLTNIKTFSDRVTNGPILRDNYVYFDVAVDPAYFAMWKGDLPGTTTLEQWPPPGEVAGIGVFSLLLVGGLGVAIMFGYRRTVVITLTLVLVAVWLSRFWTAHYLFKTKLVSLYPRTTYEIIYCLLVLSGFALYYGVEVIARRFPDGALRQPPALIGAVAALTLLFGMLGSSVSDKYMPSDSFPYGPGFLAFKAHTARAEGTSPIMVPEPPPP